MNHSKKIDTLLYIWYIVFLGSLICSFRAISSIATALILLTSLFENKIDTGTWFSIRLKNKFLAACFLFYAILILSVLYTRNYYESAKHLQTQSAVFLVPFAICCSSHPGADACKKLKKYFIWMLAAVLFFCLLKAGYKYFYLHTDNTVFFYHALVSPFQQHAVLVSLYTFIALVYLLDNAATGIDFYNKLLHFLMIIYLICCILLLSSKLVISFSVCSLIYYCFLFLKVKLFKRVAIYAALFTGLLIILAVVSTQNKIGNRFNEIASGNLAIVEQPKFSPAVYFNGLQFRLLQWRFVNEILTEEHAWLTGVADSAQLLLNKKYISTHMYTGDSNAGTRGYLGYNAHNQFLQSLLQAGIAGLVSFLLISLTLVSLAIQKQSRLLAIVTAILIAWCFNESIFEIQYGIMLFTFFPLFLARSI